LNGQSGRALRYFFFATAGVRAFLRFK